MAISNRTEAFSPAETVLNLLYPPLNLDDMALTLSSMVSAQLNEMRANGADENNIEDFMREERLNIFSANDAHAVEMMLRRDAEFLKLQPGQCFTAEAAGAPVSPDRAKNVPVSFASGNFIIDRQGKARDLIGVTGLQSQSTNFEELVEISQRGMFDDMKRRGVNISATIEVLPPSACPRLP